MSVHVGYGRCCLAGRQVHELVEHFYESLARYGSGLNIDAATFESFHRVRFRF